MSQIEHRLAEIDTKLAHLHSMLHGVVAGVNRVADLIIQSGQRTETDIMALKATDQALIAEVHRNTDVAAAATKALTTLQANVSDLTQKLTDAIANSPAADDADVQAALAELKKNNDDVAAATPALATAVANTDPAAPPPTP